MLEKIENDLFRIAERLKIINPKYVLFRNTATGKVEVHNSNRPCHRSLEFVVPYDCLDERTLEYARKTRIENFESLEKEFTESNKELERAAAKSAERESYLLADMMKYAGSQVHEVTFNKNKRWF